MWQFTSPEADGLTDRSLRKLTCRYSGNTINFGVHLGRRGVWPTQPSSRAMPWPKISATACLVGLHEAVAEPTVSALGAYARR